MKSQEQSTVSYPRFINNKPCGTDKFKGGSQERLAKSIALHFERNDDKDNDNVLPRIIGLEGGWGSGKSNVIKLLRTKFSSTEEYYFFEYDAWGHQEDLQRRSLLELLTSKLIADGLLEGQAKIRIKGGAEQDVTWDKKLQYLLARKTETITEKYPRISDGMAAAALVAVLTPIFTFIAYVIKPENSSIWFDLLSVIIAGLPVFIAYWKWKRACRKDPKYKDPSYLLAIYNDKIENDVCYETISENEPTVREFKAWMQEVSDTIRDNSKPKLIIVFDNMDRLPAEKVKELWSSIHTFFAEDGFENIWAIIPFDQEHLSCAFGDEGKPKAKELAQYFINKTFPIVYRVAEPVISDYKELFDTLFAEAFGETHNEEEAEIINRIYRLIRPKANIREIIAFINELVALELQRGGEGISLLNMAIFVLHRSDITENPVGEILSGKYLSKINRIISNSSDLQEQIAALVYGVGVEHAKQIPLTSYIEECIVGEYGFDINKVVDSDKFDIVLTEVIESIDIALLDSAIICLDKLNTDDLSKYRISAIWTHLAKQWLKDKEGAKHTQSFGDDVKALLKHTKGKLCQDIVDMQCYSVKHPEEFDGAEYYQCMNELDEFISENNITCEINLDEYTVNPNKFVDYLEVAKDKYKKYRLNTDKSSLDSLLVSSLTTQPALKYSEYIPMLRNDGYTFNALLNAIRLMFENDEVTEDNFESIIYAYKAICDESPLPINMSISRIRSLMNHLSGLYSDAMDCALGYYDIIAISLINNIDVADDRELTISSVAKCIATFTPYDNLWQSVISENVVLLDKVMSYIVKNQLGDSIDVFGILPSYNIVRNKTNNSDEELLEYLNKFIKTEDLQKIKDGSISAKALLPKAGVYEYTSKVSNDLTDSIHKAILSELSAVSYSDLYTNIATANYYWYDVIYNLLNKSYSDRLPENLIEFGKQAIVNIAKNNMSFPILPAVLKIVEIIPDREMKSKIKEITNLFITGTCNITNKKFVFFEDMFRRLADMDAEMTGRCVDQILRPVFSDNNCRELILDHSEFYCNMIIRGGDESTEIKKVIKNICSSSPSERLNNFSRAIGIELESE